MGLGIDDPACAAVHAPLALLPVPYPRQTFEQVGTGAPSPAASAAAVHAALLLQCQPGAQCAYHRQSFPGRSCCITTAPPRCPAVLGLPVAPQAKQAALAFNTMIDAVAADEAYLQEVLAAAAQEDEFTVRLPAG